MNKERGGGGGRPPAGVASGSRQRGASGASGASQSEVMNLTRQSGGILFLMQQMVAVSKFKNEAVSEPSAFSTRVAQVPASIQYGGCV